MTYLTYILRVFFIVFSTFAILFSLFSSFKIAIFILFLLLSFFLLSSFLNNLIFKEELWYTFLQIFAVFLFLYMWFVTYLHANTVLFYILSASFMIYYVDQPKGKEERLKKEINTFLIFILQHFVPIIWWFSLLLLLLGKENFMFFLVQQSQNVPEVAYATMGKGIKIPPVDMPPVKEFQHVERNIREIVPFVADKVKIATKPVFSNFSRNEILIIINNMSKTLKLTGTNMTPFDDTSLRVLTKYHNLPIKDSVFTGPSKDIVNNFEKVFKHYDLRTKPSILVSSYQTIKGYCASIDGDDSLAKENKPFVKVLTRDWFISEVLKEQVAVTRSTFVDLIENDSVNLSKVFHEALSHLDLSKNGIIQAPGKVSELFFYTHAKALGYVIARPTEQGQTFDFNVNVKETEVKFFKTTFNPERIYGLQNGGEKALSTFIKDEVSSNMKQNGDLIQRNPGTLWTWDIGHASNLLRDVIDPEELAIRLDQEMLKQCKTKTTFVFFGHIAGTKPAFFFCPQTGGKL